MSKFPVLPPFYYRDHFMEMIRFVTSVYGPVMGEDELRFLADFDALEDVPQCLYIRMINRKKTVFRLADLRYSELGGIDRAVDALKAAGFVRAVEAADHLPLLHDMTKPELFALAQAHDIAILRNWPKARLVRHLFATLAFEEFACDMTDGFVPARRDPVDFLLYLYFGKLSRNLTSFALRDLGVVNVRTREAFSARFADAAEARSAYGLQGLAKRLQSGDQVAVDEVAADAMPASVSDFTSALRDEVLFMAGQALEKRRDVDAALAVHSRSTSFESHERVVRLLHGRGDHEAVKARLDAMMAQPAHDEEYIFAVDFHARKYGKQRTGVFTGLLRSSETVVVDDLWRGDPEAAAMHHFEAQGWTSRHSENGVWTALFGLLFWDALFETPHAFASAFDHVPQSLKDRTFARRHADTVAQVCAALRNGDADILIATTVRRHMGEANGLFWWSADLPTAVQDLVAAAPREGLARVMEMMAADYYALRDGFPDLMLTREGEVRFVEVKAEGDQIRRNQLSRLRLLEELGFSVGICRVAYRTDPNQTYVVIDVETTGGRPPNDRVTEVGAVKVRGGQIIAEWSSLINPERHIPAFITELTGISDAMVADAPLFAEIAGELADFLHGAVFVAHNVNFDYGFVASEFARLDMRFRMPKLCTCASMRKYYPGHGAYGLGPLSRQYGIRLDNHHRALADAKAAAELLLLVNERRLEGSRIGS